MTTPSVSASASASASVSASVAEEPAAVVAPSEGVGVVLGPEGHLGAWLALGPFRLDDKKADAATFRPTGVVDDRALAPRYGATEGSARVDVAQKDDKGKLLKWTTAPATWQLVSSGDGPVDLERALPTLGKPSIAYLGATLRLPKARDVVVLLGVDDGCELIVDGKSVHARDVPRPLRDDDDAVPLSLAAGDHTLLLRLHQREGAWAVRVRIVDERFLAPPGVRALLRGVPESAGLELVKAMSWVKVERPPTATGYHFSTLVQFPEGHPSLGAIPISGSVLDAQGKLLLGPVTARFEGKPLPLSLGDLGAVVDEGDAPPDLTVRVEVGGRVVDRPLHPRRAVRLALARAAEALPKAKALPDDVAATLSYLRHRLEEHVSRGDGDLPAQLADAAALDAYAALAEAGKDPLATLTGPLRLAHVARADDRPQPLALYVPEALRLNPTKKFPVYVGLHGMNGGPMAMLRIFFGGDDPDQQNHLVLDRTISAKLPKLDAFVLAPHAHGNAMYRQLGEEEVLDAIAWLRARFPGRVDDDRLYVTGFSMGGIGAASIPLHHPDLFAAAQPLCGYHSYLIRRDVVGRPRRPWEQWLLEDRSNVSWIDNGARLPLWIVHGTHDLPEENSGVLIDAYEKRGFSLKHDHPDLGHDVWGFAYDHLHHTGWFAGKKRNPYPKHVRLVTSRPRFGDDAWVHLDRIAPWPSWATLDATRTGPLAVQVTTKNVAAFHLDRDGDGSNGSIAATGTVAVAVDGQKLSFTGAIAAYRDPSGWHEGVAKDDGPVKHGKVTGPIRDVWNDPLVFVYGASDPQQTEVNRKVAESLAQIRFGVDVKYPILRDLDVDPGAAPEKNVVLVGNAKSNRVLAALEPDLPLRIEQGKVLFAGKTFTGKELGAAFVRPHPRAPTRLLLVVEGASALGTLRGLSLPELLPDFVVWDESLAPARGQSLLSFGKVLAAGFFDARWAVPPVIEDTLSPTKGPKSEKDATPYLP